MNLEQLQKEMGERFNKLWIEVMATFKPWTYIKKMLSKFINSEIQTAYEVGVTALEVPCKGCGHHDTLYKTFFSSSEWKLWKEEVARRMSDFKEQGVYDVDESEALGCVSKEHFDGFIKFVKEMK